MGSNDDPQLFYSKTRILHSDSPYWTYQRDQRGENYLVESVCPEDALGMTAEICKVEPRYVGEAFFVSFFGSHVRGDILTLKAQIAPLKAAAKKDPSHPVGAKFVALNAAIETTKENVEKWRVRSNADGDAHSQLTYALKRRNDELVSVQKAQKETNNPRVKKLHEQSEIKIRSAIDDLTIKVAAAQVSAGNSYRLWQTATQEARAAVKALEDQTRKNEAIETPEIFALEDKIQAHHEEEKAFTALLQDMDAGLPYPSTFYSPAEEAAWKRIRSLINNEFWMTDPNKIEANIKYPPTFQVTGHRTPTVTLSWDKPAAVFGPINMVNGIHLVSLDTTPPAVFDRNGIEITTPGQTKVRLTRKR